MGATGASRRVMIAVDSSETSAYTFTWSLQHFLRPTDYVIVISAAPYITLDYPTADIASEYGVPILPSVEESEEANKNVTDQSKMLVDKYLQLCSKHKISCEGEVVKGEAGSWIVDEGKRVLADVVIVGSHAKGVVQRTLTGSISDYVLHNASCTVVIVRQSEEALLIHDPLQTEGPRKIVIGVDDSKEAIYAFTWALKNFCEPADKVIVFHVHHPYVPPITTAGTGQFGMEEVYIAPDMSSRDEVESLNESQKVVEKYMEYADKESQVHCEGMVVTGQTESKVVEALSSLQADTVIVGTHDRTAVVRTLWGSVSDYLAHNSPCPLIVVRAKHNQEANGSGEQPANENAEQSDH